MLAGFTRLREQHAHRLLYEEPASRITGSGRVEFVWPCCHEGSTSQGARGALANSLFYAACLVAAARRDQSRYTGTPISTITRPRPAVWVWYRSNTNMIAVAATIYSSGTKG